MAVVISERLLPSSDRLLDAEPDERLVSLVQTGYDAAFAAIVRRYERELQGQARRLTSDGRGEDAVQQAFLNAFAALRKGGEIRHLRGWLHQILRHEVTRARLPVDVPLDATVAYGVSLEDTVQCRATARATLAELSALPDGQRNALLGTAVLGFPRAHVARTMGLSEGAVRQLVHRARLRLRQAATAIIPFPLVKLFGAARSGVDAAPDAALSAGTAASGGLVIKVGALLASGIVATGIAVTHTFPARHHAAAPASGAHHHFAHARATTRLAPASAAAVALGAAVALTSGLRVREHGPAAGEDRRSHSGPGGISGTRAGRHGGPRAGHGRQAGDGHDGSSAGHGDGSGASQGGTSARGPGGGSGAGSGSGSGDAGAGPGTGRSGSGSGTGHQGDSGSGSGSVAGSGSSGSGSDGGGGSSGGGHGSGDSGTVGGSASSSGGASTGTASGPSGPAAATVTGDVTSGERTSGDGGGSSQSGSGNGADGNSQGVSTQSQDSGSGSGSGGGTKDSSGSRDVSGSLASSSS